jgi:aminocarboxymuconate-semialdehyde decarboxylase
MNSRRNFLGRAAGIVTGIALTGCGTTHGAANWRPSPGDTSVARVPVTVAGKRVKTIDVHSHCYVEQALALLGAEAPGVLPRVKGQKEHFIVIADRLAAMDAMGIDMEVLSINPFWYRRDRAIAGEIVKIQNEKLSELCAARPDRLAAFASLSLQYPDLAVQQLDDAMTKLGLRGAAIGGSVAGEDFSAPRFHPVWAHAEALGATLFIHPQSTPELAKRFRGNGWMSNVVGNPLDTTIALEHLIYDGVLDKFPKLKICAAHGGGYLGSYAPRMDFSCYVAPQNCDPAIVLKKRPSEYLRQMYYDALVFTPEALRHLVAEVGVSQVMLGSDHPIPWEQHPVDHIMNTPSLSDEDRVAILGGNAARMLGLAAG